MNVVVLSGGVGGARFVRGLVDAVDPSGVTVIGNVGDDLEVLGLHVSPDLDSILYALADLNDEERGWGRAGETWNALESVADLGGEAWFKLGDRDLGLHLVRTQWLREGEPLSAVTRRLAGALGVEATILPATDDRLRTFVQTDAGELSFQDWFVRRGHRDEVTGVRFEGAETARPAPGVLEALGAADLIVIAPSNPFVSIGPVLAVQEIRDAITNRHVPSVAVSPLIAGRAVKGPADRMLSRLAGGTTPLQVTSCYKGLIDALVYDEADGEVELRGALDRDPDAHVGRRLPQAPRRGRARGGGRAQMRIAIVGGTGTFGRALAERITMLGESVVIGSRDAARASEIAAVLGVEGATNEEAVKNADLVILAVRSNAALETARELAPAIGTTPLLSVASALEFTDDGIAPGQHGYSLAEEIERIVDAPVAAGLQSLAAVHLMSPDPPDEDVLVCGAPSAART